MKRLTYALFLTIMLFGYNAYGQGVPCQPEETGFYQTFQIPKSYPQFYTDMPYDVMIAYIAMDSVFRNVSYENIDHFILSLSKSDTLKFLRKYLYETIDYDPLLFKYYSLYYYSNKISPGDFINALFTKIRRHNYNSNLKYDKYFFESDLITHIQVLNVEKKEVDNGETIEIGICAEVLDKIKGQNLHNNYCLPMYKKGNSPISKNEVLSFFYQLNWDLYSNESDDNPNSTTNILEKYGMNCFKPGQEYIVFNTLGHICEENNLGYFYYFLTRGHYEDMLVYPIKNGIVIDEYDSFGFGKNLPVETFKAKLRERIQQIKDMRY